MRYLPICVELEQRPCLVVGGGDVAARKAGLLVRAGGVVTVVAPALGEAVRGLLEQRQIAHLHRAFAPADLEGMALVVAATDDAERNREVAALARARHLWVNVVDDPAHCNFVMPSIVDRSPVLVGITSAGSSPVLARTLRAAIEAMLPARLGELAALLRDQRGAIKEKLPSVTERRRFWEAVLRGPVAEAAYQGDLEGAAGALRAAVASAHGGETAIMLWQVALGSPDPDDLTFRMARPLQQADLVLHDADVPDGVLDRCRRDAARREIPLSGTPDAEIAAATTPGTHFCWLTLGRPPGEIDATLSSLAPGVRVVRLRPPQPC